MFIPFFILIVLLRKYFLILSIVRIDFTQHTSTFEIAWSVSEVNPYAIKKNMYNTHLKIKWHDLRKRTWLHSVYIFLFSLDNK